MGFWDQFKRGPRITRPGEQARRAGGSASDASDETLPLPIDQLVRVSRVDLEAGIARCIAGGQRSVVIGLGAEVDLRLLDDDLLAADVRLVDRELEILVVHFQPDFGYVLHRGASNFGVFWSPGSDAYPDRALPQYAQVAGLLAGDRVGLGSTPAEALRFQLPWVPGTPSLGVGDLGVVDGDLTERFRVALHHWRYRVVSFGGHPKAIIQLPEFPELRAAIVRDLGDPEPGLEVMVLEPGPGLEVARRGASTFEPIRRGERIQLGGGDRLRVGEAVVVLPVSVIPSPRFTDRQTPSRSEIASVLGLPLDALGDRKRVRRRYRELARHLHPDHNRDEPGHISRFVEIQACWEAFERLGV